jgi:hypothetical protein|nr:MAG TPA: DNA gyrase subunit A [Caudoviricetes sp.]
MDFSERFPDMKVGEAKHALLKHQISLPCCICGKKTPFFDLRFGRRLCSSECFDYFYEDVYG